METIKKRRLKNTYSLQVIFNRVCRAIVRGQPLMKPYYKEVIGHTFYFRVINLQAPTFGSFLKSPLTDEELRKIADEEYHWSHKKQVNPVFMYFKFMKKRLTYPGLEFYEDLYRLIVICDQYQRSSCWGPYSAIWKEINVFAKKYCVSTDYIRL